MMTKTIILAAIAAINSLGLYAQVQMDKAIQLTGSGSNAKIEGIDEIVNNKDAANKIYVDTAIANRAPSGNFFDFTISSGRINIPFADTPGLTDTTLITLALVNGDVSGPVGISISGLPVGVSANFTPGGGFPNCAALLTFTRTGSIAYNTYNLTVSGNGGGQIVTHNITMVVAPPKRVFVTSSTYSGSSVGGVSGADAKCNSLASAAGIGNTYLAWISDGTTTSAPANRFTHTGAYALVDGTIITSSFGNLLASGGNVEAKVNRTQTGSLLSNQYFWTNTGGSGTRYSSSNHCSNWTSTSGTVLAGYTEHVSSLWTNALNANCSSSYRLVCFEQ